MTPLLFLAALVLLGALARERRLRRAFAAGGAAFRCRLRAVRGRPLLQTGLRPHAGLSRSAPPGWPLLRCRWSRWMQARWQGDVLEIRRGPVLDRTVRLAARVSPAGVYLLPARAAGRRARHPIAVRLLIGDGSVVEVSTDETERTELVGPYLAAALSDLPKAPARRPEK